MSGNLTDNPNAAWVVNGVNEVLQTDAVEGAATGASHGGIGNSNAAAQVLANRTAYLYGQQKTDQANITTLQGQVSVLINDHGAEVYSAPGTYTFTVPANVTRLIKVRLWGGGGGGGGSSTGTAPYCGAGGGAGGYAEYSSMAVTPGQQITVTVGAGGAGGPNTTGAAGAGGWNTAFNGMTASGGAGGTGWASENSVGGNGGSASGGTFDATGASGSAGAGTPGGIGGVGGAACAGGGGGGVSTGTPSAGASPGGGGGGAGSGTSEPGGAGAPGACIIEW